MRLEEKDNIIVTLYGGCNMKRMKIFRPRETLSSVMTWCQKQAPSHPNTTSWFDRIELTVETDNEEDFYEVNP